MALKNVQVLRPHGTAPARSRCYGERTNRTGVRAPLIQDYSSERGDPNVRVCSKPLGVHSLLFDAFYFKLMIGGSVIQAWHRSLA
jgi:hypothetical protein